MAEILLVVVRVWSFMLIDTKVSRVMVLAPNWARFGIRLWVEGEKSLWLCGIQIHYISMLWQRYIEIQAIWIKIYRANFVVRCIERIGIKRGGLWRHFANTTNQKCICTTVTLSFKCKIWEGEGRKKVSLFHCLSFAFLEGVWFLVFLVILENIAETWQPRLSNSHLMDRIIGSPS